MLKYLLCLLVLALEVEISLAVLRCEGRRYSSESTVCVCNASYCDTVAELTKVQSSHFVVYTSNKAGLRFDKRIENFALVGSVGKTKIAINRNKKYQKMLGFGGAFSDSTGINIASLDEQAQDNLLKSYFSSDGIEYNLCRIPIGGTDFSTRGYSYNDGEIDMQLKNFSLQEEDLKYKIPYIKKAMKLRKGLRFFASAWTAPLWMKSIPSYTGYLGTILLSMNQVWAEYHLKFLQEYKHQGIEMWGLTTGNEPMLPLLNLSQINNILWSPNLQANWLAGNLGPLIRSNFPQIKIIILDDQRFLLPWSGKFWITNKTNEYIDGIGVHWYFNCEFSVCLLDETHAEWPDKFILSTEGSIVGQIPPVLLGSWYRAEEYSQDIIDTCLNWGTGWVDWNMVLDLNGGPSWCDNFLDSPIIVNKTGKEFYKQPMFYHLGHFSKFVSVNSVRIDSQIDQKVKNLIHVAFERPDGGIVIVILNRSNNVVSVQIIAKVGKIAKVEISAKSITTIVYW